MNTSRILMAVLAVSFLGTQPIVAADQPQASQPSLPRSYGGQAPSAMPGAAKSGVLKREYQTFKEAIRCARKEGFSKCSRAQKKRIIIAGIALAVAIASTTGYILIRKEISLMNEKTAEFFRLLMETTTSNENLEPLLQEGYVRPNAIINGIPLLRWAITAGRYKIAKQLVERGAQMKGIITPERLATRIEEEEKSGGVYQPVGVIRAPRIRKIKF